MSSTLRPSYLTTTIFPSGTIVPAALSTVSLYTKHQKIVLRSIALSLATLGLCAGSITLYWFLRLKKKTFKHTLIISLICSDMARSSLEFIYPIITLSQGDLSPESVYCEISGFFTAYFFEASDFMVLLIALHVTLTVTRSKPLPPGQEGGIWPWRFRLYVGWIILCGLLAGFAFVNPDLSYVPLVTWCYLPMYPLVWRYTLAWAPRYFVFLAILSLYLALYSHVRRIHRANARVRGGATVNASASADIQSSGQHTITDPQDTGIFRHENEKLEENTGSAGMHNQGQEESNAAKSLAPQPRQLSDPASLEENYAKTRHRVRTLFIYPLAYLVMWIPSFINNQYSIATYSPTDTVLPSATFPIYLLTILSLPAQCLVNVGIYAIRERPWRKCDPSLSLARQIGGCRIFKTRKNTQRADELSLAVTQTVPVPLQVPLKENEEYRRTRNSTSRFSDWWDADETSPKI